MDLILVRHGQSQFNLDQTGGDDAPLTDLGRWQARRAGLYLRRQFKINSLYSSTLIRARETAQIIDQALGLGRINYLEDLREADEEYGGGLDLFKNPREPFHLPKPLPPSAVSTYYEAFQKRVVRGLDMVLSAQPEGEICVVSHGGTMGTILRTLAGNHHFSVHTENTGFHILHWEEKRWHVVAVNRVEHLLSENDLVSIPEIREQDQE